MDPTAAAQAAPDLASAYTEILAAVGAALATVLLAAVEIGRRTLATYMARNAVIGAVQRAAGLALEMQRTGDVRPALAAATAYVETAVPDALAKTGASAHLGTMIQGAIGVLRAQGGQAPPR